MDITQELKKDRNQNHPDFDTLRIYFSQITVPVLTFALKVARLSTQDWVCSDKDPWSLENRGKQRSLLVGG